MSVSCGNAAHPHGPWHPATPLATSWRGRRRQKKNRRSHDCPCDAAHEWRLLDGYFWHVCTVCRVVA